MKVLVLAATATIAAGLTSSTPTQAQSSNLIGGGRPIQISPEPNAAAPNSPSGIDNGQPIQVEKEPGNLSPNPSPGARVERRTRRGARLRPQPR
jgi:hypothetical protein